MVRIGNFNIKLKPVAWRLVEENGKLVLSNAAKTFQTRLRRAIKKQMPLIIPSEKEIGLRIELLGFYNSSYRDANNRLIPDTDHVATLIQNALKGFLFVDDRQVSVLSIRRYQISRTLPYSIRIRVSEILSDRER